MVQTLAFHLRGCGFDSHLGFLDVTGTHSSCEKSVDQRFIESRVLSTGTPISSHRES